MSWPLVNIDSVAEINPRLPKETDENQQVSFIGMASVSEGGELLSEENRVLSETKKGFTYFSKEDVLLAKITPCFENGKCLKPGLISHNIGYGSTEFHVIRSKKGTLDSKYLFYMLWSDHFRFYGKHSMFGAAGQQRVSADFIRNYKIPLPYPDEPEKSLKEQKRIAAVLDKADGIRRKRQEAIQLADDFLRSVFLDMFGDPVTSGWDLTTVETMAASEKGSMRTGPFGSDLKHSEFIDEGITVLGIDNAVQNKFSTGKQRYISPEKYEQLKRYTVKPGDVLITIMGTCGRCAVVPDDIPVAINTKHLCCITLDRNKCLPSFLHAYFLVHPLSQRYLGKVAKGAIMDGLNMGMIKAMPIPKVPIELQKEYDDIVSKASLLALKNYESNLSTDICFLSLSQKAFKGEL